MEMKDEDEDLNRSETIFRLSRSVLVKARLVEVNPREVNWFETKTSEEQGSEAQPWTRRADMSNEAALIVSEK